MQIGNPELSTKISNLLIQEYGHYVQAINYPTVAKGEEKLRIAPTPYHSKAMMDCFVEDMVKIWNQLGLELKPSAHCGPAGATCQYCRQPLMFEKYESRVGPNCKVPECPQEMSV